MPYMFGEQSRSFYKVVGQSAGPHEIKNFLAVDPKHEVKQRFQGSSVKIAICCLIAIQKYNKYFGEVDVMDQRKVSNQFDHRSK